MPSKSKAQHNLMAMVANDPAASKRVGIPQFVGEEYVKADKGKKFGTGTSRARPDLQKVNKPSTRHGKSEFFAEGGMAESKKMVGKEVAFMKKKGAPKSMIKHEMAEAGMKKGGMPMKKMAMGGYADGGMPMVMKDGQKVPAFAADGKGKMKSGGVAASKMGSVRTAAPSKDGVAVKGKTKGKMVKMAYGGKAKAC